MNQSIFHFFNNLAFQNESFDILTIFIGDWLIWWLIFTVIVLFFLKKISFKLTFQIFAITLVAWIMADLIKYFYFSPRPFIILENIKTLPIFGLHNSFPSSHATFAFALATAVSFFINYKIGLIFFISAILIGLSRIIAGIHWPFDILAGAFLGVITVLIFYFFKTKIKPKG